MRLALSTNPSQLESLLLRVVVKDILLTFVFLTLVSIGATIGIGVFSLGLLDAKSMVIIIPVLFILCGMISIFRFLSYLGTVWRVMGSFKRSFKEFDLEEGNFIVDFKPPFLVFKGLIKKYGIESEEPLGFVFSFSSESGKYSVEEKCEVVKGSFRLSIFVEDWNNFCHRRRQEGDLSNIHGVSVKLIREIRQEVLESRGFKVEQLKANIRREDEQVKQVNPVQEVAPRVPSSPALREFDETLNMLDRLKQGIDVPHSGEVKAHEQTLKEHSTKKVGEKDKKSMQDALYQLEEINKILQED